MVPKTNKKNLEGVSDRIKSTKLKIKDLVIPIVIAIMLILITIFLFVPMLTKAFEYRNQLKSIKSKQDQLRTLKTNVEKLSDEQLTKDLIEVKSVIPRTLKVSSFLFYIDELAKQKNLTADSLSAGDVNIHTAEEEQDGKYKGVNGPLAYYGSLENVLSFLDSFYTSSPYIVSPKNISLEKSADRWEVKVNLTGFYIVEEESVSFNMYKPFKAYTDFPNVIETLREKAKRLNSEVH
ncbi:MAG TPA: hypothetical protein PLE51_03610 [Candidatus Pacearchaeota archaeon]|nr:hypothetical protein [Candidatus Pacearchaeota archaeon]